MQVPCHALRSSFDWIITANRKTYSKLWKCAHTGIGWHPSERQNRRASDGNRSSHTQDNPSPAKIDQPSGRDFRPRLQAQISGPDFRPKSLPGTEYRELNLAFGNRPLVTEDCPPLNE